MRITPSKALPAALIAVMMIGILAWWRSIHPQKPLAETNGHTIYYTGAMRSKGDPHLFVTEDGKIEPPPPGTPLDLPKSTPTSTVGMGVDK